MGERKALGKGLGALLGGKTGPTDPKAPSAPSPAPSAGTPAAPPPPAETEMGQGVRSVLVNSIRPNPDQPRARFDDESLRELAQSIRRDGLLQPVVVRAEHDGYILIAGERRLRAARIAGIARVPALVHRLDEPADSLRLALVENIQRQDLNPLEEARAYQELIQRCGLTQDQLAQQVSRSRSAVTNALRLLRLPAPVQQMVADDELTMGHARALLAVDSEETLIKLARRAVSEGMTVRQIEQLAGSAAERSQPKRSSAPPPAPDPYYASLAAAMRAALGTKVSIRPTSKTSGHITIDYYSEAELEGILERLGIAFDG